MHERRTPAASEATSEQTLERLHRLQEQLARLEATLGAARVGLWQWELGSEHVYYSPEWKRQLGYAEHEIADDFAEWENRIHPDDYERAMRTVRTFVEQPWDNYQLELRLRHKDGSYRWILAQAALERDGQGTPLRMLGSHFDITAQKEAERALNESQARLHAALRAARIGTTVWEIDSNRMLWDDNLLHLMGRTRDELERGGPSFALDIVHKDDREYVLRTVLQTLESGSEHDLEFRVVRPDGSIIWVRRRGCLERDARGQPVRMAAALVDITRHKQLEHELREAQKLEAIGKLAGGVAHDFNNILLVVLGQASLLSMRSDLPSDAAESVREIERAAERAANLTSQLLAFGRRQVMQPRDLDLNVAVGEAIKMLQRMLGEQVTLLYTPADNPVLLRADPTMLTQVLLNLTVNARDAMPQGGQILIHSQLVTLGHRAAQQIPDASAGRWACLVVRDTGAGIPAEVLPRIFEPFFTTKSLGQGTGLGLATVYGIVKQHRGFVSVDSAPGTGTTFKVYLPASHDARPTQQHGTHPARAARGRGQTVLLIEDEPAVRSWVETALVTHGYRVLSCAEGQHALQVWAEQSATVDLVLSDVVLPGVLTGAELVSRFRREKPSVQCVLTSGHGAEVVGESFTPTAGISFLQKPYSAELLLRTLETALSEQSAAAYI